MSKYLVTVLAFSFFSIANAGPNCTSEPKEKWLDQTEFQKKISEKLTIVKFKVTRGNCYEVYGKDSTGKDVEFYYHPVTGEVVGGSKQSP